MTRQAQSQHGGNCQSAHGGLSACQGPALWRFNVRSAPLVTGDYIECMIEADRLDDGGRSQVTVRVADILSYVVLKILAFQDRHENRDAYDLIFCLLNYEDGPGDAGQHAAVSTITGHQRVHSALALLTERFESAEHDGPHAYGAFLDDGDTEDVARLRQEAVAVVRQFLAPLSSAT